MTNANVEQDTDLFSQQRANRRRSVWLILAFLLFFAWLGFGGDWILWQLTRESPPGAYRHGVPWLGAIMVTFALGAVWISLRRGAERVLWSTNAREVQSPQGDLELRLVNVVEEMAIASGLPRPRVWIVPDDDPNAFATGQNERTSHVAVTQGLLETLDRDELQAVIAHEMGHVKNLDVRLMTLLAALVGAVALVGDGMARVLRGGGRLRGPRLAASGGGGGGGRRGKGGNPLLIVVLVLWIVSWLLAPLVTRLLALGVSRRREYLADAMSAQFTRNPLALAAALQKIEHAAAPTRSIKRGSAHLCIADPLGRRLSSREGAIAELFGTHPPMAIRVARLKAMGYARRSELAAP